MSQLSATAPARAIAAPSDRADRDTARPARSRIWAVLEALAYAGATIDPSGVLVSQRFRRYQDEQRRYQQEQRDG
jgi:hypothetical protein